MAADRTGRRFEKKDDVHSSDLSPDYVCNIPKRHVRVTVKYNRKELQKRLDVEKWIEDSLDQLYLGQVGERKLHSENKLFKLGCFFKNILQYNEKIDLKLKTLHTF